MRKANALIVAFVALAVIVAWLPGPAYAQVVTTTTSTLVDRFGNTITTTDTFYDGVLVFRDSQQVRTDGTVTLVKHWDFYASGALESYTEQRLDGFAPYKIEKQYDQNGVLRNFYSELYINGELAVQSFQTFDANGFLLTKEDRVLTTLADGTKVWTVTYATWSGDVLVSSQVVQYPYGYDFSGGGDDGSGDDSAEHRPGWGHGDENHVHDGPPGHEEFQGSGSGGSGGSSSVEQRPGDGFGDKNHDHSGAPGSDK